jgi:ATP-dependent DNA ligase
MRRLRLGVFPRREPEGEHVILDGDIVAAGTEGQSRLLRSCAEPCPASFTAFDLLRLNGRDLLTGDQHWL